MAKRKPRPGFRFPGPVPREALDFFDAKDLRPGFDHRDVSGAEHAAAFTVAKAVQLDILDDIRAALRDHLAEGKTFESFKRELEPVLRKKGWWGRKAAIDPRTGKAAEAQLGSPARLRTIFRANLRAARAAGQWERVQRTKRQLPYLLYRLGPSEEHRAEHVAWDGTLLPADDPWWSDHMPPNGWGCKCWVRQVSEAEARKLGGATARPERDEVEWTNPRTKKTIRVDRGLDPAWASNPGRDRQRILAGRLIGELDAADEALAAAAVRTVVDSPLLERQLAPMAKSDPPKGDLPIGHLDSRWQAALGSQTRVVRLTQGSARKQRLAHPDIVAADYREPLREVLRRGRPLRVTEHRGKSVNALAFFLPLEGGRMLKAAIHLDGQALRLASFHESSQGNIDALLAQGARWADE